MFLKFLALLVLFVIILRFVARFFLWKIIGKTMNQARFHAQNQYSSQPFNQQRRSRGKNFDQIQDADFEDVTEPEKDD